MLELLDEDGLDELLLEPMLKLLDEATMSSKARRLLEQKRRLMIDSNYYWMTRNSTMSSKCC